jgi:hypothetical protein
MTHFGISNIPGSIPFVDFNFPDVSNNVAVTYLGFRW